MTWCSENHFHTMFCSLVVDVGHGTDYIVTILIIRIRFSAKKHKEKIEKVPIANMKKYYILKDLYNIPVFIRKEVYSLWWDVQSVHSMTYKEYVQCTEVTIQKMV